jgi:hypothetical protein
MDDAITTRKIRNALREHRYAHANEIELHGGVEQVLTGMGLTVDREVRLSDRDRIDIMTDLPRRNGPPVRLGIEVKVKGSADGVARQLFRYASHDRVDALILVTTMYRHMSGVLPFATPVVHPNDAGARWLLGMKPFEVALISRGLL